MNLVILIIVLALIEYMVISFRTGMARVRYGVQAPAISGHQMFERYFRVQQNTLEQIIVFIPALLCFSWTAENVDWPGYYIAAGLGVIWLIGRYVYFISYIRDPNTRMVGFLMTMAPSSLMLLGTLICILIALV